MARGRFRLRGGVPEGAERSRAVARGRSRAARTRGRGRADLLQRAANGRVLGVFGFVVFVLFVWFASGDLPRTRGGLDRAVWSGRRADSVEGRTARAVVGRRARLTRHTGGQAPT